MDIQKDQQDAVISAYMAAGEAIRKDNAEKAAEMRKLNDASNPIVREAFGLAAVEKAEKKKINGAFKAQPLLVEIDGKIEALEAEREKQRGLLCPAEVKALNQLKELKAAMRGLILKNEVSTINGVQIRTLADCLKAYTGIQGSNIPTGAAVAPVKAVMTVKN